MVQSHTPTETLETPPVPEHLLQREIPLTENARKVLEKRYLRKGLDGKPIETIHEMFWRVAWHVAAAEDVLGGDRQKWAETFFDMLTRLEFLPNSPTFTGAGTPLGQLAACFTADMRVATIDGLKRIADLQVGDLVLTHQGRFRPVTQTMQRSYNGPLYRIKVKLIGTTLEVTPEHPLLTPTGWTRVEDLRVGDKVAVGFPQGEIPAPTFDLAELPFPEEIESEATETQVRARRPATYQHSGRQSQWCRRFITLTPEFARLCGYYVAEGTIDTEGRYVRFTLSTEEREYQRDIVNLIESTFGISPTVNDSQQGRWTNIDLYSRTIATWFQVHFGRGSAHKRLPSWLLFASREVQEEFLVGLFRGDGLFFERLYTVKGRKSPKTFRSFRITLANPGLVHQIWQMVLRLGYHAAIRPTDTTYVTPNASETAQVSMPPLQSRDLIHRIFGIELSEPDERFVRTYVTEIDGRPFFEIERIEIVPFSGTVYNCEVAEDHSYITEGIAAHNCFVLPIEDDMGKIEGGIFDTLRNAALIQQTGGGNGFSFSRLRPKGAPVHSSAGIATGPVGFLRVYDKAFGEIAQGGSRRGANMGVLRVDHPDIREFISCKAQEGELENFNISVAITDAFMEAVKNDAEFELVSPQDGSVWERVRARELFDEIVKYAHHNGEPGVLFIDAANRDNPVPHLYELEATNPCFVGDTRIPTEHGLLTIRELAERDEPFHLVTDNRAPLRGKGNATETVGTTVRRALRAFKTRENVPVLRLRTRMGYSVVATPDHPFLTPNRGYVALEELHVGDTVLLQSGEGLWSQNYALPNVAQVAEAMHAMAHGGDHRSGHTHTRADFTAQYANLPREWSHDLGLVLGWLIGDGWLSPNSKSPVGMVFSSSEMQERVHAILRQWFGDGHVADRGSHTQLTYGRLPLEFFTSLGVEPVKSPHKRVPHALWSAPREAVVGFLQGLFSADGSVQVNPKKQDCTVRLASSSRALLEDVQLLLLNFGIVSRLYERRPAGEHLLPDGQGGMKPYSTAAQYELVIGKANRNRFAHLIGFADTEKQARLLEFIENQVRGPYRERFEDQIVAIEEAGTADVYDLVEPETHSFIANGLVVHNCGEQWLGPYENCCLGSVNLARHLAWENGRARLDWEKLAQTVRKATRFLDDVVTANKYVPAVPELREAAERARRIGLGIMGLADVLYALRVRYGSPEGQELAAQIMEWVRYHAMLTSIELAQERGPFPAIEGSIYDPNNLKWRPPTPLEPYTHDWGRPAVEWERVVEGIKRHGIRNAAQTTIAPTGTLSTVSGVEGYGCEPVFALSYIRHVSDGDKTLDLYYFSPLFEQALTHEGVDEETRTRIKEAVALTGSCQNVEGVPEDLRHVFVVASDITPEEHVRMQAALQRFVDNSISKTINFPETATVEDVAKAYFLAWELGCKGITVYVTGSREKVVLETKKTMLEKKGEKTSDALKQSVPVYQATDQQAVQRKARPRSLTGTTYFIHTPLGKAYVTVNRDEEGQPFEVFANVGKAGSDIAAVSEAIGRLISLILRLPSPMSPEKRLEEVIDQLSGIGGGRPMGFGANRVLSLPDALARVLKEDLQKHDGPAHETGNGNGAHAPTPPPSADQPDFFRGVLNADICPDCGHASLVNEEGCRKCYSCGYSEC